MLNQRIDIAEVAPPFLLSFADNTWHLVVSIKKVSANHYQCECRKKQQDSFISYTKDIAEAPFHVAENIWELSYGGEIMTLLDNSLNNHPAKQLWSEWKQQ